MPDASEILFTWLIGPQAFATCTGTHSAAVLGGEALAGSPDEVHAACDAVDLIEPEIVAKL